MCYIAHYLARVTLTYLKKKNRYLQDSGTVILECIIVVFDSFYDFFFLTTWNIKH